MSTPHVWDGAPTHDAVPVRARVVFEVDGAGWLDGVLVMWQGRHVFVRIPDPRLQLNGVWLDAKDVQWRP